MKYNELGNTGIKVSHVSLGGASFSNFYGAFDEENALQLIRETLKCDVNYMETGPWYGAGTSERTFGKALVGVPRSSYFIGSKVGRYEQATEKMFDFSSEKTESGVDRTLQLLGLDYVDLIQVSGTHPLDDGRTVILLPAAAVWRGCCVSVLCGYLVAIPTTEQILFRDTYRKKIFLSSSGMVHDCTFAPDISVVIKETLPALERAVKDGKARYIGLADYDIELMKEVVEESDVKISTILSYAKSTLCDNRLQNYTSYFKGKGVGVINAAATGMGLLSNHGPQPWHPASDDIKAICKRASDYCKEQNVELARLATWFTLNQPGIDTNICGFYNVEQLRDTVDVLDNGLTDHEQQVLHDVQLRFIDNVALHWDNVELPAYKAKLNKIQRK